jgi:hypothetical protein
MSARARRRLVNSALRDHPIASETLRTYEAVQRFKDNIAQWLENQGLFLEVNELKEFEMTDINKVSLHLNMQLVISLIIDILIPNQVFF